MHQKWNSKDLIIIKENHNKKTLPQIYKMLSKNDISYSGFRAKCQRMGLFRGEGLKLPNKNTFDLEYWKKPTLMNAYLAGFIAADGSLFIDKSNNHCFSVKVSVKDEHIIDLFKKELKYSGPKKYINHKSPNSNNISKCVYITLFSFNKNFEYLKNHYNLTPLKTKRIGPINLKEKDLILSYLIGSIDGDGTIAMRTTKQNGREYPSPYLHICSASKKFVDWFKEKMDEYYPPLTKRNPKVAKVEKDNLYRWTVGGLRAAIIINSMRKINVPKFKRKWENPKVLEYADQKKKEFPKLFL